MTVFYPDRLPVPQLSGYKVKPDDAIARTEMEGGPARQRRRFTQVPTRNNCTFIFTEYEMMLFEAWHKHEAKEGAAWFRIKLASSLGVLEQDARFTEQWDAIMLSKKEWQVTTVLEIRERPILAADELAIVLDSDPFALTQTANNFHDFVNTTLPSTLNW